MACCALDVYRGRATLMSAVNKIVVVGSGRMAPGIAAAGAATGSNVVVVGRSLDRANAAVRTAAELGADRVEAATLDGGALDSADLVIETVVEDAAAKEAVLAEVETLAPPGAVLTTNTSGLRISALAAELRRPEQFAGLHFLYPAHLTGVVEVIPGVRTSSETIRSLEEVVRAMGKTPLSLTLDVAGGIWNRLQFALLREALFLLDSGVADPATIDAAVSDGLAPRWVASGPLATADLGGLDTFSRAAAAIMPTLDRSTDVPMSLRSRAQNRAGFFVWTPGDRDAAQQARAAALRMAAEIRAPRPNARCADDVVVPTCQKRDRLPCGG
jgi:3-hydroxybutyryl-CoA dehydrogenase